MMIGIICQTKKKNKENGTKNKVTAMKKTKIREIIINCASGGESTPKPRTTVYHFDEESLDKYIITFIISFGKFVMPTNFGQLNF